MKPLVFSLLLLLATLARGQVGLNGVPQSLLDHLTTGINVTRWFCYTGNSTDTAHFQNYLSKEDFAALQRLHIRFVRLCLSPDLVYAGGQANTTVLTYIDQALDRFDQAGIAVIFDLHDNGQLKLDAPGQDNQGFLTFWQAIAQHYKGRRETMLVFELANEPVFRQNPDVWYALQQKTVDAIRAIDPARTIMVSPTNYSSIDTLVKMVPLPDKNLLYTFHCYDPFFFTHQGATWAGDFVKPLKDIPFPSSPEAVEKMISEIPAANQAAVRFYGKEHYDQSYLEARLKKAVDWGQTHGVPVVLGEFGAYPKVSPPDSRARWFAAMRTSLADVHVANSLWGYDDSFGLGRRLQADGSLWLDPVTLQYLYAAPPAKP